MNHKSYHAPYLKVLVGLDYDWLIIAVSWDKSEVRPGKLKLFHSQLAVKNRNNYLSVLSFNRAIHDK